jgi:hypothetical protein
MPRSKIADYLEANPQMMGAQLDGVRAGRERPVLAVGVVGDEFAVLGPDVDVHQFRHAEGGVSTQTAESTGK